jgi:ATP-binding cassette subfamily B protein
MRVLGLLRPSRGLVAVVVMLGTTSIVLNVSGPRILGHATDIILAGYVGRLMAGDATKADAIARLRLEDRDTVAKFANSVDFTPGVGIDFDALSVTLLFAFGIYALSGLAWIVQGRLATRLVQHTIRRLRRDVEAKLTRLPVAYFDQHPRGDLLSRSTNDIDNLAQTMQQAVIQVTNSVLLLIGVLTMMLWISPLLALVAVVAVPVSIYATKAIGRRAQRQFAEQWRATGALSAHVEEMYSEFALIKVFGRQAESAAEFREQNERLTRSAVRAQWISGLIAPVTTLIGNLSYVIVAVVGGLRVASGSLSIGEVQAFIQYSRQFTQPLSFVASLANLIQSGVASAGRVFELLDEAEEIDRPATAGLPRIRGEVVFESVDFRYRPDQPLIENLSLTARPGQLVAVVGRTGAGKTTLVNLLLRFYEIDAGRITVDGVDIRTLSRDELRSNISMVLQDTWLFGGTIWDNIAYGRQDASDSDVLEAARAAQVDHFVRTLSDGYHTRVDQSAALSAGEKQLITIARAILADPAVLVLDEATSAVDTRTELLIQRAMGHLSQGRTSFVIAHRLSTIRQADMILMMADGQILERGTHDELLAAGGPYAELLAAQFAQPVADLS